MPGLDDEWDGQPHKPLPNCRCTIGPTIMADTGDHWPTPERGRRIKPEDLRVECWTCGGTGQRHISDEVGTVLFASQHLRVSRIIACDNPTCQKGLRRPLKAVR